MKHNRASDQIAQANTHTQRYIDNTLDRWSPSPLALPLYHFSSLVYTINMGYLNSHFVQTIWVYSNNINFQSSDKPYPMTTNNPVLYIQDSHFTISQRISISLPLIVIVAYHSYILYFQMTWLHTTSDIHPNMSHFSFLQHVCAICGSFTILQTPVAPL